MEELFNDVCTMYDWTHSVNETARNLGLSTGKVRKILITEGYNMGYNACMVKEFSEKGLSVSEIASKLNVSQKTVLAYLPYTKGSYMGSARSGTALRSERYRNRRRMLDFSDRVLSPKGDYGFVPPSSRDILVYGGFFQFNLSALIRLCSAKTAVSFPLVPLCAWHDGWEEEELFDEPPIVLEFNPTAASRSQFSETLCVEQAEHGYAHMFKLLNCHRQAIEALNRGDKTMDVYFFPMEQYLPYITKHFREFASYWNEKLSYLLDIKTC